MFFNPIICAVDTTEIARAKALAASLKGEIGAIKLGLEFFCAHGAPGVREVIAEAGIPLFLDLKFHDIPNTVAGAVRAVSALKAHILTVHTAGGGAMMKAAADAAKESAAKLGAPPPLVVGVTILTSMDQQDIEEVGYDRAIADQTRQMAAMAQKAGLGGVVCSPHEIEALRGECGKDFALVVPGIRPAGAASGDQKRVMTPRQALDKGATYLVIGRPITEAPDSRVAARGIAGALE